MRHTLNGDRLAFTKQPHSATDTRSIEDRNTCILSPCFQLGFTEPEPHDSAGALLTHLCTLTCCRVSASRYLYNRRYFSVALSSRSLALGVIQQLDLHGSPDFPQNLNSPSTFVNFETNFATARLLSLITIMY